ncbi:hypothetical protein [Paenibacillus sp. 1781tsa1]|uniref:hypothetical protein n=1 Tax=Paenibacillus sp. 1781tsa1 TaxID=2953810 RepID=UPI00209E6F38|nr:hypothetical protein [Paenibacillus sp. 1781tsa1]MCP1183994.1 hypothetical protein [Paenibacillus sp. 1781tsa1]
MNDNEKRPKKSTLMDIAGLLKPDTKKIKEQKRDKTFDQIREEALTKHTQEQYEKLNSSNDKNNETIN